MEKAAQEKLQKQREKAERKKERQAIAEMEAAAPAADAAEAPAGGSSRAVKKPKVKALRLKVGMKMRVSGYQSVSNQLCAGLALSLVMLRP